MDTRTPSPRIRAPFSRLRRDDRGATAVEYGLLIALIAVVILVAVATLGGNLRSIFNSTASSLVAAGGSGGGGGGGGGPTGSTPVPAGSRPNVTGSSPACTASVNMNGNNAPGPTNDNCNVSLPTTFDGVAFVYTVNGTCTGACGTGDTQATRSGSAISVGEDWTNQNASFQWCYTYAGSATYAAISSTCFTVAVN